MLYFTEQEVIQTGYRIQDKSKEALQRAKQKAEDAKLKADEIQVVLLILFQLEIQEQFRKLEYIDDKMHQMEGTLKRVQRHLRYFARNYMTDKLIMGLICLILVAILGVLIYSMVGSDDSSDDTEEDEVKQKRLLNFLFN